MNSRPETQSLSDKIKSGFLENDLKSNIYLIQILNVMPQLSHLASSTSESTLKKNGYIMLEIISDIIMRIQTKN